ncbi:hypothetical protein [Methylorubrum extorquens]|uniref:hypothetical protein n=1 Tax=Methylorubrum extorquens TaxID=408 RepID=UPI001EE61D2E|nr:hypothetical protein [Methylorubrum extorquens]MCG5249032.1 hypothetical protein [Methylorubrum extorquens]
MRTTRQIRDHLRAYVDRERSARLTRLQRDLDPPRDPLVGDWPALIASRGLPQCWSGLGADDDLARPPVPGESRRKIEAIAVGDWVGVVLGISEVRVERRVHVLVGDGLGHEEFADSGI